ncbi:hypothetical protein WQ57_05850 [Mesobacillus campisalis]|uniref:Yip1 domain-containing protein n=1 Tax=Mesobacillus campisalis TaxID=1408103 RepID=A0A0M2T0W5_9BACI|nr:hypothetical protein [Mesobacillus campisalis]KKK38872.1 hypothetical protein WQ57_05850 [Mesobacillus campisalis]
MMYQTRLIRGLRHPDYFTYELKQTEDVGRVWRQTLLLILLSGFVFGLSAFFGLGSEYISARLTDLRPAELEMHKALFIIGQILRGLFYGAAIIYLSALWFWSMTDTDLNRFVVVQMMVLLILLLEQLLFIPISFLLGVPAESSPFSLGPIAQVLTGNTFLINFLASITIFKLWAIYIQYIYVRSLTEKPRAHVLGLVIGLNLMYWLFNALFSIIQFEKII